MIKRIVASIFGIIAVVTLLCLQVDLSRRCEDSSQRKVIKHGETGLHSRDHVPFSKVDPRTRTISRCHRSTNNDFDFSFLNNSQEDLFTCFISKNLGSFPRYHSTQIVRKEKIFILNQVFRI